MVAEALKNKPEGERLEGVRHLIEGYQRFAGEQAKAAKLRTDRLRDSLDSFWEGFSQARAAWERRDQTEAPRFNFIRLLGIQRLEQNHSKILKELLDPKGIHGQGKQLLECFLDCIGYEHLKPKLVGAHVEVKSEVWVTEKSRVDIIIRCFPWFILVVENKIRSGEGSSVDGGPTQLQKYWDWLQTQDVGLGGERILVFLTIHPQRASIQQAHCITYLRHIQEWLQKCLDIVSAPRVQETLRQYFETVEELRDI